MSDTDLHEPDPFLTALLRSSELHQTLSKLTDREIAEMIREEGLARTPLLSPLHDILEQVVRRLERSGLGTIDVALFNKP